MDSQWQLSKCGSAWQSSAEPAVVVDSSPVSQVQSHDSSRNLMINPSHLAYPHTGQEPCSSTRKMTADPMFQSTNINLFNSSLSAMGTSFFTLLSGSPSSSLYDSQQVLGLKPSNPSRKVHVFNSRTVGPTEREAAFGSPKLSSQNINKRYLKSKSDTFSVVLTRTLASEGGNSASCLHDIMQARRVNDPVLELGKEANYHTCHGIEQLNEASSLKAVPLSGKTTTQSEKLHSLSTTHQPSPLVRGLRRVFCLYASGDLFLSNSGLLGVVCSCHGFHMSISKFSEHSGLRDVNPGDAVHMDSGETVAQWRKVYFCKFGIRIPEDQCGWHWPEGFSTAAEFVKSSERVSNLTKSSNLSNSVGPPRSFVASKQPLNIRFLDNNHPNQNFVSEILRSEPERNTHDNHKLSNGFTITSQDTVRSEAGNKIMEQPVSGCSSMSKLVGGTGDSFQSGSTYIDPIYKARNRIASQESLQNLRSLFNNSDKFNNSRDGDILERPTASSNIELRLGQPSEQGQILPGFHTPRVSRVGHPLELISSRQLLYNEESEQFVNCAAQAAKCSSISGQNQLSFSNLGFGAHNARMIHQPEQLKGDVVAGSVNSMLLSHLGNPKDKVQPKDSNKDADDCQVISKQQYVESRISKLDSMKFGCNTVNSNNVKFSSSDMGNYSLMDREKGLGRAAKKAEPGCHAKFVGCPGSSFGFGKTSHDRSFHVLHDLSNNPFSDHPNTIFTLDKGEHGLSTSITSRPTSPRPPSVSGAPLIEFSSVGMNSIKVSKEEGTRVMNSHASLSTKSLKYSNQDDVPSSCGFDKDQNVRGNSLYENLRSSITLPSESTERQVGYKLASKFNQLELATQSIHSGATTWIAGGTDKSALISASQVTPFQIRDIGVQCNHLCDRYQPGPQLPRIGIGENICSSSGYGSCCKGASCAYVPEKCSCLVQRSSTIRNSNLEGKRYVGAFGEPSKIGTSILSASNLDKDRVLHVGSMSSGKIGDAMKPNSKKVEFNAFQWKDVPSKMVRRCHLPCKDETTKFPKEISNVDDQISDVPHKCFDQSVQKTDCLKEQVMSNISSKCSAPALTQASVKISNGDSCTDDAQNTGCAKNFAVDEGSGIQKCWSSDDALDSESNIGVDACDGKINSKNDMCSKEISKLSTRSLIDELRLIDSLRLKKIENHANTGLPMDENTSSMKTIEKDFKSVKRKRETMFKTLGIPFPALPVSSVATGISSKSSQSLEEVIVVQHSQERSKNCTSVGQRSKRRPALPDSLNVSCMKDVDIDANAKELPCKTPRRVYDDNLELPEFSNGKRVRLDFDFSKTNQIWKQDLPRNRIPRPVVCGRYGLISNGDTSKPAKIFSLLKILKTAKRCATPGNEIIKKSPVKAWKKSTIREGKRCKVRISDLEEDKYHVGQGGVVFSNDDPMEISKGTVMACFPRQAKDADTSCMLEKGRELKIERSHSIPDTILGSRTKRKNKVIRKRSLYELMTEGKDSGPATISNNIASVPQDNLKNIGNSYNLHGVDDRHRSPKELAYKPTPDVDMCCHVCGSLNNDEMDRLLECKQCLIKVHQACYGVSKVPSSCWYCRPCRENATNMVCVLCGYEGGVMTRALQSSNIVRSLLKAWNCITDSRENRVIPAQVLKAQLNADAHSGNEVDIDVIPNAVVEHMKASLESDKMGTDSSRLINKLTVLNSVTAGIFDPTVKQWVHMVCGLWTPGTRCPNVDTMSAFDVSGASFPKGNVICSLCKRAGGCCVRCRVMGCAIHFHPWCAHRKGLLQSEVEGANNDKVGFYARCELHVKEEHCSHKTNARSIEVASLHEKETCARTEGYKGRKREGFRHDNQQSSLVRQEQVDAWNHINQLMSCKRRFQRMPQPVTDVEYDFRKEYSRYKQSEGWKHLVVYKSGIHALGLYTSSFISQSAMVVEYIGEVVGLRVADRREVEYRSGKQLQYKSACYFFRIDKEHIIDATLKGGVARFVNHSCQPNCVAKVITVRGEKKVVFFSVRDIYPGEEITYDYHFNNEDEGEKILCSCNSIMCRRYLN